MTRRPEAPSWRPVVAVCTVQTKSSSLVTCVVAQLGWPDDSCYLLSASRAAVVPCKPPRVCLGETQPYPQVFGCALHARV